MAKSKKSSMSGQYGNSLDKAIKNHAGDETSYGPDYGSLPGGIRDGVAQIVEAGFGKYKTGVNKGEWFFRAAGVITEPATQDGKPVAGKQTSYMEQVCETTKADGTVVSQADHIESILNTMRTLGVETDGVSSAEELEDLAAILKEAKPYFRFTTSQSDPSPQYPDPRVWENWQGSKGMDDYEPPDSDGVEDDTSDDADEDASDEDDVPFGDELDMLVDKANDDDSDAQASLRDQAIEAGHDEETVDSEDTTWEEVAAMIRDPLDADEEDGEEDEDDTGDDDDEDVEEDGEEDEDDTGDDDGEEDVDFAALGKAADKEDEAAIDTLTEAAAEEELDPDSYPTWAGLGKAIKKAKEESGDSGDGDTESDWVPEKSQIYLYKHGKAKKSVEHEVQAVNNNKRTCTVKNLDDSKLHKNVSWDDLEEVT